MEYRKFGQLDFEVSALGFGCMRLPTKGKDEDVDDAAAVEMLRYAIDHGVNYLDTAYPYHGGNSERVVAAALEGGYREKAVVATKMPVWEVKEAGDLDRIFAEQLARLRTDHVEFYLLHNLQAPTWANMRKLGAIEWLEKLKADGKVGHIGFSFHDKFEVLKDIIDAHDGWDFCQLQYNYVCEEVQAGTEGLEYAAAQGLGVVVMEPLFGGTLANPPEPVRRVWDAAEPKADPVATALKWLWDKPEVSVVLSGMSTLEQVKQNVRSACAAGVGKMTPREMELIDRAREQYKQLRSIPCTNCGYCLPCPNGVAIPDNFQLYNNGLVFKGNAQQLNRNLYADMPAEKQAQSCTACGECEDKCPQGIKISEWMPRVHEELTKH